MRPRNPEKPSRFGPAAPFFLHLTLASIPLLATLALIFAHFPNEGSVADFFSLHRAAHPDLKLVMKFVTNWVHPSFYLVYAWLLIRGLKRKDKRLVRFTLAWLAAQLLVSLALVHLVKMGVGRPRPGEGPLFSPMTNDPDFHSLPSGHSCDITVSCLPLALWTRRTLASLALGGVIALVGFSRIYLGWHHPTDVFFGWLLGGVAGAGVSLFANPNQQKSHAR